MSKSILLLFLTMPLFVSCYIRISEKPKTENTAVIEMDMNTYLVDLGIDDDYYPTELLIDSDMDGVLAAYDGKGTAFFRDIGWREDMGKERCNKGCHV